MQNKTTNRWLDVQIVIATLALTISLALWNMFASANRLTNSGVNYPSQNTGAASSASAPVPQTRVYFNGAAPQSPSLFNFNSNAPAPVTITGSSRP